MKNKEYWAQSLNECMPTNIVLTDELIENIMNISEMEYEYTESESTKGTKADNKYGIIINRFEKENRILKDYIAEQRKVDSVNVENGRVVLHSKLP